MRKAAVLALATVAALMAAPAVAAENGNSIARAAAALRSGRVYVAPAARVKLSSAQVRALERQIATDDPGRIFVAVLPDSARVAAGGTVAALGAELERQVGKPGVYAIIAGSRFEAGSNAMPRGEAATLASASFAGHRSQGPYAVLSSFVALAANADPGPQAQPQGSSGPAPSESQRSSSNSSGIVLAAIFGAIVVVIALLVGIGGVRRRRRRRERMAEVRKVAREDQIALGDDIRELDIDVSMPGADAGGKADYAKALDCYEAAGKALEESSTLGDLAEVTAKLEEGRWLMESARARLAGRPPPERRAPCFFDPRHGPSVRDVDWAPDGGAVRPIPVCAADATRIEDGQSPEARTIVRHGRRIPFWEAPPYYGPYAGGYYGDWGGTNFLTGFVLGSVLDQHESAGGDWSAGSWNTGGDFGGGGVFGDSGGGFGGGGDFGGGGGGNFGGGGGGDGGGGGGGD